MKRDVQIRQGEGQEKIGNSKMWRTGREEKEERSSRTDARAIRAELFHPDAKDGAVAENPSSPEQEVVEYEVPSRGHRKGRR